MVVLDIILSPLLFLGVLQMEYGELKNINLNE